MSHTDLQKDNSPSKYQMTVAESVFSGSVAGAVEVLVNHPLWSIKTRIQGEAPFTLNPGILYRGILPNAASMIPVTAIQVGLNRCFQMLFFSNSRELTDSERLSSAFVAGVGSAFVSCPTEMIMTRQGKNGGSFYTSGSNLFQQRGWSGLYSGMLATMLREGLFTTFLLGVTPLLKAKVEPVCSNDFTASVLAGITAGVGATLASQPVDTVKTCQQIAMPPQSILETAKKLYFSQGFAGFFKGSIPRGSRVISAVTIIGFVNDQMEQFMSKPNSI